ncbi:MAG: glycosyl hydrolase [Chlorobi bacterium OLB7]|nr:MAG: glycosyl hydrolase [Chlorobi bacterium OLB7]
MPFFTIVMNHQLSAFRIFLLCVAFLLAPAVAMPQSQSQLQPQWTLYAVVLGNQDSIVGSSTLGSGLFRSVDAGQTWDHLGPRNLKAYSMDAVDRSGGQILFIAAGNGVHKSTDYGKTWRITTSWQMTEVMDLKVSQEHPQWVFAATAWGLWRSSDGGETWHNPKGKLQKRYIYRLAWEGSTLIAEEASTGNSIRYRSGDQGESWTEPNYGSAAASPGDYFYQPAPPGPSTPPANYYVGFNGVQQYRADSAAPHWADITANLPTRRVHALLAIPQTGTLLAGTFGRGLWRKELGDTAWQQSGLGNAQVWSLVAKPRNLAPAGEVSRGKQAGRGKKLDVRTSAAPSSKRLSQSINIRRSAVADSALHQIARNNALNFQFVAAKLMTGTDTALAWRQLDTLLRQPKGDIFWMYPATGFYFYCRHLLSQQWRDRFRQTWGRYTPYRGDTENHFLMYYSSLLLFSQEWPDLPGSQWFNGKSSRQIRAEATEYLRHWIDETATKGMTEWDSPRYHYYYMAPLLLLQDFAGDQSLRRRCGMMLEFLLADAATEYLGGSYCGAHSRDGESSTLNPRAAEMNGYINFYLRDTVPIPFADLAFAAISPFRPPEIIREILDRRDLPFVHREVHRSRGKMRFSTEAFTPVAKQTFINRDYAIGSMQGGIQSPIQQHTWDVTFAANRPNNTIVGLNPYASAQELGTFFPEEPDLMLENIGTTKAGYRSPDKWIGGSPFEQVWQHRGTLIAHYHIPPEATYPHVDLFFPNSLDTLIRRDPSGWIICRMEGGMVGVWPFDSSGTWSQLPAGSRYRSGKGYVVETASGKEMEFADFIERLRQRRPSPNSYTTIHSEQLTLQQQRDGSTELLVNGAAAPAIRKGLRMEGPFLECTTNGVVTLRAGAHPGAAVRVLDFSRGRR